MARSSYLIRLDISSVERQIDNKRDRIDFLTKRIGEYEDQVSILREQKEKAEATYSEMDTLSGQLSETCNSFATIPDSGFARDFAANVGGNLREIAGSTKTTIWDIVDRIQNQIERCTSRMTDDEDERFTAEGDLNYLENRLSELRRELDRALDEEAEEAAAAAAAE